MILFMNIKVILVVAAVLVLTALFAMGMQDDEAVADFTGATTVPPAETANGSLTAGVSTAPGTPAGEETAVSPKTETEPAHSSAPLQDGGAEGALTTDGAAETAATTVQTTTAKATTAVMSTTTTKAATTTTTPEGTTITPAPETSAPETNAPDADDPASLTYEEYLAMTPAEQQAHFMSFASPMEYMVWFDRAKAEYEANKGDIVIEGDGSIDIGDIIDGVYG